MKPESRYCHIHKIEVFPFYSQRLNKYFWKHEFVNEAGEQKTCWVQSEEEIDGFREKQIDYGKDNLL